MSRAALAALLAGVSLAVGAAPSPGRSAAGSPSLPRANLRALVLHDLAVSPVNRALVRAARSGAGIGPALFGDLTGDGRPEAVVPLSAGGASGVGAYFVYAVLDGRIRDILPVNDTDRAVLAIERRGLVEVTPVYRPRDPRCCPSAVRTTVLRWDGQQMTVLSSRRQPTGAGSGSP
jgi:hypothetical protein